MRYDYFSCEKRIIFHINRKQFENFKKKILFLSNVFLKKIVQWAVLLNIKVDMENAKAKGELIRNHHWIR